MANPDNRLCFERAVIVTRKTELEELVARFNTVSQARFYLEHSGAAFGPIEDAHNLYFEALKKVRRSISSNLKVQVIDRDLVPQYTFVPEDLVVTIGQDGIVSNTAKYLDCHPILAVNPNPALYDGILLPFTAQTFERGLTDLLRGEAELKQVSLAIAETSDGQSLLAFNDLFIGARTHVSARYDIHWCEEEEYQSSSGIIVSTGAGSTGWMRSVYTGASNIVREMGGDILIPPDGWRVPWDADLLTFAVREPFPSHATGTKVTFGQIAEDKPLVIRSHMPTNGVIFSDGMEADYIAFNSGTEATISVAPTKARLVV